MPKWIPGRIKSGALLAVVISIMGYPAPLISNLYHETSESSISIQSVCPSAVDVRTETDLLLIGSGMAQVRFVIVDDRPVPSEALNDTILDVLLPGLSPGQHLVQLTDGERRAVQVTVLAREADFAQGAATVECLVPIIDMAAHEGLLHSPGLSESMSHQTKALSRILQDQDADGAWGLLIEIDHHVRKKESSPGEIAFAEAWLSTLNSALPSVPT